jgi:hypothetical protein
MQIPCHPNQVLYEFLCSFEQLLVALERRDFRHLTRIFMFLMEVSQHHRDLKSFCRLLGLFGDMALYFGRIDQALFIYTQCNVVANYTRNYKLKIKALLNIALCARK